MLSLVCIPESQPVTLGKDFTTVCLSFPICKLGIGIEHSPMG